MISQLAAAPTSLTGVVNIFIKIINGTLALLALFALIYFLRGVIKLLFGGGGEKSIAEGKNVMKGGILALFIIVSIMGILALLYRTFGFDSVRSFGIPLLPHN